MFPLFANFCLILAIESSNCFCWVSALSPLGYLDPSTAMATPSPSPLANATNILPPSHEDNTLAALSQALAVTFFIMGLGYFSGLTGFVPRTANKGIGPLIGQICLPLLIFRSVAKLDLSSVEWGVVVRPHSRGNGGVRRQDGSPASTACAQAECHHTVAAFFTGR